jgi:polysaccharide deacetylase family protein (PEP-CTERM system associated)
MEKIIKSAFTIDVECGINISMRDYFKVQMPPTERVVSNTHALLRLLFKHRTNATFFVLGDVAKTYPSLVKEIVADGHEVGVHSFGHNQLFKLSPDEALKDTRQAKDVIENIIARKVFGYRAPAFSVMPITSWALPMLAELGFTYDSSIMPVHAGRYGWPGFPNAITNIDLLNGRSIIEFPLSVTQLLHKQVPACGGGYLRLFPYWLTARSFVAINQRQPVNVYMHPYEIDTAIYPDYYLEAMQKLPLLRKLKLKSYRINKGTVLNKLDLLLGNFVFDTMKNIIETHTAKGKTNQISIDEMTGKLATS